MNIVSVADIPKGEDVPMDNLFKVYNVCMQLQALCEQENGIGIAAVQAGIPWRLFLVKLKKFPDKEDSESHYEYYLNCDFQPKSPDKVLHIEGCLSLKTPKGKLRLFEVERYKSIEVNGYRLVIKEDELDVEHLVNYNVTGFYAAVFQHEIQHADQITIDQIGKEKEFSRVF
ncbi:MAG: hypothetical protein DWQ19_10690 [Crenarchaeota archaeon]|nr:MAG: hypothetical protein DWQ19_10690 [Thermoproteota archaeon]